MAAPAMVLLLVAAASSAAAMPQDARCGDLAPAVTTPGQCGWTSVKAPDVRDAQRKWIAFRDAWVRFGAARHPATKPDAWIDSLTRPRAAGLRDLADALRCD